MERGIGLNRLKWATIATLLLGITASAFANARSSVALAYSSGTIVQTSNTAWTLTKTGTLDTTSSTVIWTVTATEGTTTSGQLFVDGFVTVTNSGAAGEPIGNIVVNDYYAHRQLNRQILRDQEGVWSYLAPNKRRI